jgi:hypothetical protein
LAQDEESQNVYRIVVRHALARGDPANLPIHFEVAVLDRYRGRAGFSIIRTDTVGRLRKEGGWSIDFGIAPGEQAIHANVGDLMALPDEEREHWAGFALLLAASKMFLQMRLSPSACYDDGEVREW